MRRWGSLFLTAAVILVFSAGCAGPDSADTSAPGSTKMENIVLNWENGELINTGITGGYPRLYALQDGTLLLGYDGMFVSRSIDNGLTWSDGVHASGDHPGTANAAFFQAEDGTVYLGFRSTEYREDGSFYSSIQVSVSTDGGHTWAHHSTVYENVEQSGVFKGVWEPHFGMMNGYLTCFYANDCTNVTSQQNIEYQQWDPETQSWINRTIVSAGRLRASRDGMPVWTQLSTGEYVCVMEAFNKDDGDRFCIQLTWSADGKNWSKPVTVMRAAQPGAVCAAPYVVELPTGQLVISCQTNELGGGEVYYPATVISDGTQVRQLTEDHFSAHTYPMHDTTPTVSGMWNGMYVYNGYLFLCTISGDQGIRINRLHFYS